MKMPPKAKIYEAFSAIADKRITISNNEATIKSSDFKKTYQIKWQNNKISSTDNATFWQGYPGYPIIAVWLTLKIIDYDKTIINYFKNINWHELNNKYKKDYNKAVEEVLANIDKKAEIIKEVDNIYAQISRLNFEIVRKI